MKKGLFLLFVLLVLGSVDCFSQSDRWVLFAKSDSELFYYDSKTIKYENDCVSFFFKIQFKESVYSKKAGKYKDYLIQKLKIYCEEYKIKYILQDVYYTDGTNKSTKLDYEDNIVPDTQAEDLLLFFCR